MKIEWRSPKTIVGPPATGDYFYPRKPIIDSIWEELEKGNNILITAPRRVGKTSILQHIKGNGKEGYNLVFENIQSISSSKVFYQTIYLLILNSLNSKKRIANKLSGYVKTKKISKISLTSIEIEYGELDYLNELNEISSLIPETGEKIILLLDELPEVLYTLYQEGKPEEAVEILKNLRKWRQDDQYKNLKFVLSGSIGLHYVVNLIAGRSSDINDLKIIHCEGFNRDEATDFIRWATKEATIRYKDKTGEYLIDKTNYCVPYYLNLMLDATDKMLRKQNKTTVAIYDIDNAFESVLKENRHFEDWKNRLRKYLPLNDFSFVNEILIHTAHKGFITLQEIYNKAMAYEKVKDYMAFVRDLENDGYLIHNEDKYMFQSPFLKEFWKRDNPIYNE